MDVEIVIAIALLAILAGASVGYFLGKGTGNRARVKELEEALETSQPELADYRREVYGQFAQTAEKIRALDESYNDLHRQLAESSVALCGDAATPLLAGPSEPLLSDTEEEKTVDAAAAGTQENMTGVVGADEAVVQSDEAQDRDIERGAADELAAAASADAAQSADTAATDQEVDRIEGYKEEGDKAAGDLEAGDKAAGDKAAGDKEADVKQDDAIVVGESTDVPVLTETQDTDETAHARRSA